MRIFVQVLAWLMVVGAGAPAALAGDADALIGQLASDKDSERAGAIAALRQMGDAARPALLKADAGGQLKPQQLFLVRRLVGDLLIAQSTLKPIDVSKFTPCGEDKEKGIKGNPNLLVNVDKRILVLNGDFAQEENPLEFLVLTRCPGARLHETVVAVVARPRDICTMLYGCAYVLAGVSWEDGKITMSRDAGVMISVEFLWETPHAAMDGTQDPADLIAGLVQKQVLVQKAEEEERARLLFDMEGDAVFIRRLIDHDVTDDATGKVLAKTPFTDEMRDEKCVYDDAQRKALVDALQEYLKKHPKPAGAGVRGGDGQAQPLPEKKLVRVPIEYFAWNTQTSRTMKRAPFAFTGSRVEKDQISKKVVFRADQDGSLVALKLDPYAVFNTPLDTNLIDPQHSAGYGTNRQITPRRGTKCRVVLEPWTENELKEDDLKDTGDRAAAPAPPPKPGP